MPDSQRRSRTAACQGSGTRLSWAIRRSPPGKFPTGDKFVPDGRAPGPVRSPTGERYPSLAPEGSLRRASRGGAPCRGRRGGEEALRPVSVRYRIGFLPRLARSARRLWFPATSLAVSGQMSQANAPASAMSSACRRHLPCFLVLPPAGCFDRPGREARADAELGTVPIMTTPWLGCRRLGETPARWMDQGPVGLQSEGRSPLYAWSREPAEGGLQFVRDLESGPGALSNKLCLAFAFIILTATRGNEARDARWDEIDLVERFSRIPGSRMKMRTRGPLRVCHHLLELVQGSRQPGREKVRQQAERGVALGAVPASDARPARGLARIGAVARERAPPLRVVRTARKPCIAPRPGSNV